MSLEVRALAVRLAAAGERAVVDLLVPSLSPRLNDLPPRYGRWEATADVRWEGCMGPSIVPRSRCNDIVSKMNKQF